VQEKRKEWDARWQDLKVFKTKLTNHSFIIKGTSDGALCIC
jgi:hypothetical protein